MLILVRWKDAAEKADVPAMRSAHVKLLDHIGAIYKDCKIDKADLEAEGLGLRPLTAAENMGRTERNILARRYYRLGQWSEALQGDYWLTVGSGSGLLRA
jgi:FKBP12-rapamycin complex-associated protein